MTRSNDIVSCLDSARVKVLLLPLDSNIKEKWSEIVKIVKLNYTFVDLTQLEASQSDDVIMKKLGQTGMINFNFITSSKVISPDFIDFQLHHRLYAVIGIKSVAETDSTQSILADHQLKYPYPVVVKEISVNNENLNSVDLSSEFDNLGIEILKNMSEMWNDLQSRPAIPSPCGIEDYAGTASRSSSTKPRMRLSGRTQKLIADLHLLTGSYSEAVACYVSASEDAKAVSDLIWSAGSQEGFNTALCLQNEQMVSEDKSTIYRSLIEKLLPLSINYERSGTPILSIDLQITCSRVYRFLGQGSQALNVLSDAWKSCNLLAFEDKISAFNRILSELADAGNWRKWCLYMVQLAQILKSAQRPEMALITLSKTLEKYHITEDKDVYSEKSIGWPSVQSSVLMEMLKLSETHSNRLLYFLYGWMYLAHSNRAKNPDDQVYIIENLRKRSMKDMFSLTSQCNFGEEFICSLPIFVGVSAEKMNEGIFVSGERSNHKASGPFIYNPVAIKSSSNKSSNFELEPAKVLAAGEIASFKLVLCNPFMFPFGLKNIHLITDDCENPRTGGNLSIILPPLSGHKSITVDFTPRQAGKIRIMGMCATFMNIEVQFLINSKGLLLSKFESESSNIGLEFDVIDSQPLLNCSCPDLERGLQLYEGESLDASLNFINLSNIRISKINCKIAEDLKENSDPEREINDIIFGDKSRPTFSVNIEDFDSLVKDGTKAGNFAIPLKLFGSHGSLIRSGILEIFYSSAEYDDQNSDSVVYWRRLVYALSATIYPILQIDRFTFHPLLEDFSIENIFPDQFENIKNTDDFCVASFVASNLESTASLSLTLKLPNLSPSYQKTQIIPSSSSKRFIFLLPRLQKTATMKDNKKLPLNEKIIAAVRKLRKTDTEDFLDDTFEEFLYDHDQFWLKMYLIGALQIDWQIFDEFSGGGREGTVSLIQSEISPVYFDAIFATNQVVRAEKYEFKSLKYGQEVEVKFIIRPDLENGVKDFKLKIHPLVLVGNDEVALNYQKVLLFTGSLECFIRNASWNEPREQIIKFYPIAIAAVKIIFQVIEIDSGNSFWGEKAIYLKTTELE